jgi:predicted RNase H-like HicB family nuclease
MIYLKALTGIFGNLLGLHLHILLTEEDDVVVARCLDFSVSSHGEDEKDALLSLSDSIQDYLSYAIQQGNLTKIIDPEEEIFWRASLMLSTSS